MSPLAFGLGSNRAFGIGKFRNQVERILQIQSGSNTFSEIIPPSGVNVDNVNKKFDLNTISFDGSMSDGSLLIDISNITAFPITVEYWWYSTNLSNYNTFLSIGLPSTSNASFYQRNEFSYNATNLLFSSTNNTNAFATISTPSVSHSINNWYYVYREFWSSSGSTTLSDNVTFQSANGQISTVSTPRDTFPIPARDYRLRVVTRMSLGSILPASYSSTSKAIGNLGSIRISSGRRYNGTVQTPPTQDFSWDANTLYIVRAKN